MSVYEYCCFRLIGHTIPSVPVESKPEEENYRHPLAEMVYNEIIQQNPQWLSGKCEVWDKKQGTFELSFSCQLIGQSTAEDGSISIEYDSSTKSHFLVVQLAQLSEKVGLDEYRKPTARSNKEGNSNLEKVREIVARVNTAVNG